MRRKKRGIKPILGCEVYVAPGAGTDRSGTPGETANHLVLLAETNEGFHNLIKLVSSGYTEGFYYKPRIDKDLLATAREGPHRPEQLPEGRGRRPASGPIRSSAPSRPRRRTATSRAQATSSSRCRTRASPEQGMVNAGLLPIARDLGLPLVCTNDVHYLRQTDQHPHDVLLCIGTGKSVSDEKRLRYHGDQFFLKTAEEMWRRVRRLSRGAAEHGAHRRALQRERCRRAKRTCRISRCRPASRSTRTSSTSCAKGFAERLPRWQGMAARGELRAHAGRVRGPAGVRDRHHPADEVSRATS